MAVQPLAWPTPTALWPPRSMHSFSAGDDDSISCTQAVDCVPSTPADAGPALTPGGAATPPAASLGPASVPESVPRATHGLPHPEDPRSPPRGRAEHAPGPSPSLAGAAAPPIQLRLPFPVLFATLGPGPGPRVVALVLGSHAPPHEPTHALVFDPERGRCLWSSTLTRCEGGPHPGGLNASSMLLVRAAAPAAKPSAAGGAPSLALVLAGGLAPGDPSPGQPTIHVVSLGAGAGLPPLSIEAERAVYAALDLGGGDLLLAGDGPDLTRVRLDPLWRSYTWGTAPPAATVAARDLPDIVSLAWAGTAQGPGPARRPLVGLSSCGGAAVWNPGLDQVLALVWPPDGLHSLRLSCSLGILPAAGGSGGCTLACAGVQEPGGRLGLTAAQLGEMELGAAAVSAEWGLPANWTQLPGQQAVTAVLHVAAGQGETAMGAATHSAMEQSLFGWLVVGLAGGDLVAWHLPSGAAAGGLRGVSAAPVTCLQACLADQADAGSLGVSIVAGWACGTALVVPDAVLGLGPDAAM
ncbi:hypothetical protein ACKKBF_B04110 [Auxenochlorella protothecoides x Auxenochlorella symbiontica]